MAQCHICTDDVPAGWKQCPSCLTPVAAPAAEPAVRPLPMPPAAPAVAPALAPVSAAPPKSAGPPVSSAAPVPGTVPATGAMPSAAIADDQGAVYTLETPARCPHCQERIRAVRVLRMKRTQAAFTSPLPRGGRVVVCSACDGVLSADLSTL